MKLRPVSDVHSEFFDEDEIAKIANERILPPLPDDSQTALLLCGDIGSMSRPQNLLNFLNAVCPRFAQVLYIPGNHEYYSGNLQTTVKHIEHMTQHIQNLFFAAAGVELLSDVVTTVHMHTLWTDYDKENPLSMNAAAARMNDYRLIGSGNRLVIPDDMLAMHKQHLEILEANIEPGDIVMTHHTPSLQCVPEEYLHDRVNGAYHSDLEGLILRKKPSYWFCGHTHTAKRFKVGETTVIINPHGYGKQYTKNGYNPTLVVEV